jgi:hypothetical protein
MVEPMSTSNTSVSSRQELLIRASTILAVVAVAAFAAPSDALAQATQQGSTLIRSLSATRAALDKYNDPMVAVRDGYFSTVACIEFHGGDASAAHDHMAYKAGAMGVHFLNTANIGPTLDSLKPQALLYEPVGEKLRLVAAEWFVPLAVAKTAPTIFGQTLEGPMEGHQPIMPEELHHWDLHVWLWKDNPAGMFSPTNANVKCSPTVYGYSFDDKPPKVVR